MAFGTPALRGEAISIASGTTLVIDSGSTTPIAAIAVGSLAFLRTGWDNEGTSDADTTQLSVTDSQGNTWTRAREHTNGSDGANAGACCGVFYSVLATALGTSDSITVTSTSARTSKAAQVYESTTGGTGVNLDDGLTGEGDGSVGDYVPSPGALSGLANVSHLWVGAVATESTNVTNYTEDGDYTQGAETNATTGTVSTSMTVTGGHRIFTGTSDTWDPSGDPGAAAVATAWCFVAFSEAVAAVGIPSVAHRSRSALRLRRPPVQTGR